MDLFHVRFVLQVQFFCGLKRCLSSSRNRVEQQIFVVEEKFRVNVNRFACLDLAKDASLFSLFISLISTVDSRRFRVVTLP